LTHGLGSDEVCERIGTQEIGTKYLRGIVKKNTSQIFAASSEEALGSDNAFANRMTFRTMYSHPPKMLKLGVIIRSEEIFRVCVQPACDSVRLTSVRSFPFLSLEVAIKPKTHYVVADDGSGDWIRLVLGSNPRDITMLEFEPGDRGEVEAEKADGAYIFTDIQGEVHKWVGELKPDLAQKVAVDLAHQFARVAVDEAEQLRLSRK